MAPEVVIDARLTELVGRMVESSLSRRSYQAVMGLALEARRCARRLLDVSDAAFPLPIANAPNQKILTLHLKPTPDSSDSDKIEHFLNS